MTTTVSLSTPLTLPSGRVLPNRLMKSALSEGLGDGDAGPDVRLERLYSRWATGEYGLVVTGNVMVDRRYLGEPGNVVIEDDRHLDALARWAKTTQDGGSPIWMQLNHPGRQANPLTTTGQIVAPSAVRLAIPGMPTPRELTDAEIDDIIVRFATAAAVAESAGFDGVQIHGAHGYLISQFLSPRSNRREDRWGGSIENRTRFALEVIRRVRAVVRPGFGVGIKLNSADFQRGGFSEDDSRAVVEMLAAESLDLIEISGGSYESPAMMGRPVARASTQAREAYFLEYAVTVRGLTAGIPLAVTGGFRSRTAMADALAEGACDIVGIGRPTVTTPRAGRELITDGAHRLEVPLLSLPVPAKAASAASIRSMEGALDLQWHTDQLHRMGDGLDPDPRRPLWRTAITTVRRNGIDALRTTRGPAATRSAVRKFRFERAVGRHVMNPAVAFLSRIGVTTHLATDLETIGRRSGQARIVPVSAAFDDDGAWVISQHGTRSGWAINVAADSRVRIRQGTRWRRGSAEFVPGDDVDARARTFATRPLFAGITAAGFRALQSDPISVRITFLD
ncbi:nitroreductase family deazaflavin-dependent oxidoreductase [Gordonia sp. OPL2]|uniref:nitroreductase family deazaflavin-dependent oxidoreductase n=1 Tax=Gordonia sp. OPL2 TaxID=2486274 RepID=UPI001655FE0A|nr:nitroreductase family deazaflavin-dependent oxidoreductase [Gordonia sp. OPL2]ROZ83996.1 nitroreductase family deazaflavin-dependent oxidoreductase [Gordonia sp. OPL2]